MTESWWNWNPNDETKVLQGVDCTKYRMEQCRLQNGLGDCSAEGNRSRFGSSRCWTHTQRDEGASGTVGWRCGWCLLGSQQTLLVAQQISCLASSASCTFHLPHCYPFRSAVPNFPLLDHSSVTAFVNTFQQQMVLISRCTGPQSLFLYTIWNSHRFALHRLQPCLVILVQLTRLLVY
jgi:hypothetical protein